MAPKLTKAKLSTMTPTDEELTVARAQLAAMTTSAHNSKKASLRTFLRSDPDIKVVNAKGAEKHTYLERLHTHVLRNRNSQKSFLSTKELELGHKLYKALKWYCEEELEIQFCIHPRFCNQNRLNHK